MGDVTARELKVCPRCKHEPRYWSDIAGVSQVECAHVDCRFTGPMFGTKKEATEWWNNMCDILEGRAPQLSAEQGEKVSYETLESAFNDRVRVIEMQLRDKEILESELSRLREQLSQTPGLSIRDSVLCWLGTHRDKMPPETVSLIQDLLGFP